MPLTRVYLPLTPAQLAALARGGSAGPAPLAGHAVTSALGRPGLVTDEEELEHAAWLAATESAIDLSAGGTRRRVVAARGAEMIDQALGFQAPEDLGDGAALDLEGLG